MKKLKKIIGCLVMTATILLGEIVVAPNYSKATGIEINKSKLNMKVGDSYNLKLDGTNKKVSWSTNKKKVVKVNKFGKVKALRTGKATVTAKVGKKKCNCKVNVEKCSVEEMSNVIDNYFARSKDYKYYYVAYDLEPMEKNGKYTYSIRSTGGNQANILVGSIEVNPENGNGVLKLDFCDEKKICVTK